MNLPTKYKEMQTMKKRATILLVSGVLLFAALAQSANAATSANLAFERDSRQYVIDGQTAKVTVYDINGSLLESLGTPAAGPGVIEGQLPPALLYLLLAGKGSIGDLVWDDLNGDGVQDDLEPGIQGVRVYVDLDGNQSFSSNEPFAITDSDGKYEIKGIRPGTYTVYADTLPPGYSATTPYPVAIVLGRYQVYTEADFGFQDQSSSTDGYVWNDSDANGSINNDETPIAGVNVYVDTNEDDNYTLGEPLDATDSSGYYQIAGLAPGTYEVHVDNGTLPVIYHRTPVSGSNPTQVSILSGQNVQVGFGYQRKVTISGTLRDISGNTWANVLLFIDLNGNGVYDPGEPAVRTDMFGRYSFGDLLPGTYTVLIAANQLGAYDILAAQTTLRIL